MIQIDLGCILRYFPFGPVADFREAISQMVGSQATRIKMVYASLSAPEAPTHPGAALRYKGILADRDAGAGCFGVGSSSVLRYIPISTENLQLRQSLINWKHL